MAVETSQGCLLPWFTQTSERVSLSHGYVIAAEHIVGSLPLFCEWSRIFHSHRERSWPHPLNRVRACVWLLFEGGCYSGCGFYSNKDGMPLPVWNTKLKIIYEQNSQSRHLFPFMYAYKYNVYDWWTFSREGSQLPRGGVSPPKLKPWKGVASCLRACVSTNIIVANICKQNLFEVRSYGGPRLLW